MLEKEVIVPDTTEWVAPIVFSRQKDDTLRFCVDYGRLNAVTQRDYSYLIQRMD